MAFREYDVLVRDESGEVRRERQVEEDGGAGVASANERTLQDRVAAFQQDHRDYLALAAPTAAQTTAWARKAARNLVALNRLALREFSSTE